MTDLNTLVTALYVKVDDWLGAQTRTGRPPRLTDAELLTLAVARAFPYLPGQSGYNKRLRSALPLLKRAIRALATDTDLWDDPVWVVDSTPVECGRSRVTAKRSNLAGWAGYGYCASHSRFFWGLRLHLVCTPALDLEQHGARSPTGIAAAIAQRILALTTAIWHNRTTGQPITRSLIAYDPT